MDGFKERKGKNYPEGEKTSIIEFPYERREKGTIAPLDESLVNYVLGRFAKHEMTILDPFAGDKTIEKCGRNLRFQVISLDIKDGHDAR